MRAKYTGCMRHCQEGPLRETRRRTIVRRRQTTCVVWMRPMDATDGRAWLEQGGRHRAYAIPEDATLPPLILPARSEAPSREAQPQQEHQQEHQQVPERLTQAGY